jgi:parvulin-like peptidyl-prolyl isomerase
MTCRKVISFSCLLLLLASVAACTEKASPPPVDILVKIDSRIVTLPDFRRDFEQILPKEQQSSAAERDELQRSFLAQIIDRELALAAAAKLGVAVSPAEVDAALAEHQRDYPAGEFEANLQEGKLTLDDWKRELKDRLVVEKLVKKVVGDKEKVSAAAVASYYRANSDEFDRPAQVRARQIVVASEAEGEKILALLKAKTPFAQVAKEHSLSPDAAEGGDLGFFARGEMPAEFDAVVFTLPVGRLSPLIKSEYGYHIFLVEERRDAGKLSLAQAHEEIRATLQAELEERLYHQWLDELRAKAKIEVNWALLDKR